MAMSSPPNFDPSNNAKLRARGVIIIAAIVAFFIAAIVLIQSCGGEEKQKTPVATPVAPGQPLAPAQGGGQPDPTAQPSSGDSTEDYIEEFNVAGAKLIDVKISPAGANPPIIGAKLGDKIRFFNLGKEPIRVASADSDKPYAFDSGIIEYKRSRTVTLRGIGRIKYTIAPAIIGYGGDSTEAIKPEDVQVLFGTINVVKR